MTVVVAFMCTDGPHSRFALILNGSYVVTIIPLVKKTCYSAIRRAGAYPSRAPRVARQRAALGRGPGLCVSRPCGELGFARSHGRLISEVLKA